MKTLDLSTPLFAADRSTAVVIRADDRTVTVRLTAPHGGSRGESTYFLDGRSIEPGSDGRMDLTNDPPRTGRCIPYRDYRFHEDL